MREPRDARDAPQIVILTCSDDADMDRVAASLRTHGLRPVRWRFDGRDQDLQVDAAPGSFHLGRAGQSFSSADVAAADVVIHRIGIGQWERPVTASGGSDSERRFAEREWSSLLSSLLIEAEYRYPHLRWANSPSASLRAARKYQLLATADLDDLRIPDTRVSTQNLLPASSSGEYVCKAIDENEDIDRARTLASARLPDEIVEASPFRTDCPSLIQERVPPESELRVYYLFGSALGISIAADRGYSDIRLVPRESLAVQPADVPSELAAAVGRFCRRHELNYCAFDFLSVSGRHTLVDVTPGGTWSYYEMADAPFITDWYTRTLLAVARSGADPKGFRPIR
jgi:hypothetical protein